MATDTRRILVIGLCFNVCLSLIEVVGTTKTNTSLLPVTTQPQTTTSTSSLPPTTTSSKEPTTTSLTTDTTSSQPDAAFEDSLQGSKSEVIAAGVSVAVALVIAAVVIVLVLRSKEKVCFASSKSSSFENIDDSRHVSLARVESKPNAYYQTPGAPVFHQTYSDLQNTGGYPTATEEYYSVVDNGISTTDSEQNDFYQTPGSPASNHTYSALQKSKGGSKVYDAPADKGTSIRNNNGTVGSPVSANAYFILEKEGFEQPNAAKFPSSDVHNYFVLGKQQPAVDNASMNDRLPYFVLQKQNGVQPVHEKPSNDANPYFILEKEVAAIDKSTPFNTLNVVGTESDDGDMYQEIDTTDEYLWIDDSRDVDNNDYDCTKEAFRDSKVEVSDNIYNKLNSEGEEYDHLRVGNSSVRAAENEYDVTSTVV